MKFDIKLVKSVFRLLIW